MLNYLRATNINPNYNAREIPSPPPAATARQRGESGERARVRGQPRQPGKHRTRTAEARDFARRLRKESTDAEKRLWRLLRDRRFAEFKFRRQYPCGIYFLDFHCTKAKLAVELDGGGHGFPDQRARDEKRNQFLAGQGIKVLRFWNHQLRGELEAVRFEIWHALMEQTGRTEEIVGYLSKPAPSPQPSPPTRRAVAPSQRVGAREKATPSTALRAPSPSVGEKDGMRGNAPRNSHSSSP